ncbi:hypothetical protein CJF31_00011085 [Rutstroemia sp. NJR-2017a BVV2]|nr:hypothetical protein CJF31_00011085 [Rutstroemia sp. NJR-2017a BVV2]
MTKARQKSSPKPRKKDDASTRISRENSRGVQGKYGRSTIKRRGRLNDLVGQAGKGRRLEGGGEVTKLRNKLSGRNTFYHPNGSLRSPITRSRSLAVERGMEVGEVIVISDDEEDDDEYEDEEEEEEEEEEEVLIIEESKKASSGRRQPQSSFSWHSKDLSPPTRRKSSITKHPRLRVPSITEDLSPYISRQTPLKTQPSLLSISSTSTSPSPRARRKKAPQKPSPSPSLSPPPRRTSFSHQPSYISLSLPSQPPEYYIQPHHLRFITPGTVLWLPSKIDMLPNAYVDPGLHVNAFDHPAVILSVPSPLGMESVVEVAIVSFFVTLNPNL